MIFSILFEIVASSFDSILCVFFIAKYLYMQVNKRNITISILATTILIGITLIGDYLDGNFNFLITVTLTIVSILYAITISRKQYWSAICAACIFEIAVVLLSSFLYYTFSAVFNDFNILLYGENNYARYIYVFTHKILLFSVLQSILYFRFNDKLGNINGIITFIFSIITVIGLSFTMIITEKVADIAISTDLLIIALIFLALNILLYTLLFQISRLHKKNHSLMLLSAIEKHEEEKYQEALSLWTSAEKIRHDNKHHMIAISTMIDEGKFEECRKYVDEYLVKNKTRNGFSSSGNSVIDYLIDAKFANLSNIQIIVTGSPTILSDIQDTDLASLMGNILDNAIEAQEKVENKYIELSFSQHNNDRIIVCKNSIETSVLQYNKELKTTKKSHGHGYGSIIIADVVKKYNGLIQYFEEDKIFGIQIIIPIDDKNI